MRAPILAVRAALVVLIAVLVPLGMVQQQASAQPGARLSVVTSTGLFVDLIQRVGGDRVDVFSIVPAGADPHTFQPTPRDVQRATQARVAVWNGLGLDEKAEAVVASLGANPITVTLSEGIEPLQGELEDDHGADEHAGGNPHMWLDPTLAMRYVAQIRDALAAADPANADEYGQNADTYLAEIAALDAWAVGQIETIPPARRKLVTFHDAFPYLARRYGLDLVGVVLKSPGREPSAQEVAELVTTIKAQQIPTVYKEPQFNARILELAARDAGVQVRLLYSDALDAQVSTYLDMMRFNVTSLVDGLR